MWSYCCPLRVFRTEGQQSCVVSDSMSDSRMNRVQLTLEQHGFGPSGSTYARIFSVLNTTALNTQRLVEAADGEPQVGSVELKDFPLRGGSSP